MPLSYKKNASVIYVSIYVFIYVSYMIVPYG